VDEVPLPPLDTLLLAVVLMIGLGALLAGIAASQPRGLDAGATAISTSLTGTFFAQLSIGVLGVLLISGEYSTGMIRASLAVVPARLPMLWAKLVVCAGAVFLTMFVSSSPPGGCAAPMRERAGWRRAIHPAAGPDYLDGA
jgi:ABC-2 type transport system permease protein